MHCVMDALLHSGECYRCQFLCPAIDDCRAWPQHLLIQMVGSHGVASVHDRPTHAAILHAMQGMDHDRSCQALAAMVRLRTDRLELCDLILLIAPQATPGCPTPVWCFDDPVFVWRRASLGVAQEIYGEYIPEDRLDHRDMLIGIKIVVARGPKLVAGRQHRIRQITH